MSILSKNLFLLSVVLGNTYALAQPHPRPFPTPTPPLTCVQGSREICGNNFDDNCNGIVDEGCPVLPPPMGPEQFCMQRAQQLFQMPGIGQQLCRGTQSATAPVDCYTSVISQNVPKERGRPGGWTFQDAIQLCAGTSVRYEPLACYSAAMFGDVPYSFEQVVGGTVIQWNAANALNLCKGTNNASGRLSCFSNGIAQRQGWETMIPACAGI